MKQIKKRYYVLITLALIVFLVLFFLSTFIKNYINKNSLELTGRKIELGDLHINYFKVAVSASDLMVYETNQVDTFAGFRELSVNFDPTKLFRNTYSFSSILVDSLFVNTIMDENGFNFDDLMPVADSSATETADTIPSSPFRFAIHDIRFIHGHFNFIDKTVDNEIKLVDFSLNLPLIAWDSESSDVGIDFNLGEKGKVFVGARVDQINQKYAIDLKVDKFSLKDISSYAENAINIGGINGYVNTDLRIRGSMENTMEVYVSGYSSLDSVYLWEPDGTDLFRLQHAKVTLDTLDIDDQRYNISEILVKKPVITASLYKDMSNFERVLLPLMATDSLQQDSIAQVDTTAAETPLNYKVTKFKLVDGEVLFADNTLYRPFLYDLKNINIELNDIANDHEHIPVSFSINLNDQGRLAGQSFINMVNPLIFSLDANFEKMQLLSFSPYSEYHIARPVTQGDLNYHLNIDMQPTQMVNTNNIVINELEIGEKTQNEAKVKAPVKLGLYLMKDPKDVIKIDMPVEGNPSDPNFSVSKLIWKALSNLLVKAAASPFNALGNLVGTRPEELEYIPMPYAQDSIALEQKKTLDKIAHILEKKPQLVFKFAQRTDPDTEKDVMAVAIAKKQMLTESMPMNSEQQIERYRERLSAMEDKDPDFIAYLRSKVPGSEGMSVTAASRKLIGEDQLDDAFTKLLINRNENISYYLTQEKGVDSTSIEVRTADLRNLPEQLKSCNYKVEVSIK
ncbi:DUF748 domain-containing protein [Carboxylicivirga sp. RSCT41]|uniref:DUF748 domain-containing protein n=1 Tax=Carboxylicivirga agarovorans TaxID=3417570 RepID=UPI003D32EC56